MTKPTLRSQPALRVAAAMLLCGAGLLASPGRSAAEGDASTQTSTSANTSDVAVDQPETFAPVDDAPVRRRPKYRGPRPRNPAVLVNTCDTYPCGSWPSYYDMPPPIRPRAFYGYEPHRSGWPGYRHGWNRWDW